MLSPETLSDAIEKGFGESIRTERDHQRAALLLNVNEQRAKRLKSKTRSEARHSEMINSTRKPEVTGSSEDIYDDWSAAKGVSEDFMQERSQEPDIVRESL